METFNNLQTHKFIFFSLKSDRFGMETCFIHKKHRLKSRLKSDRFGMETETIKWVSWVELRS